MTSPVAPWITLPIEAVSVFRKGAVVRRRGTLPFDVDDGGLVEVGPLPLGLVPGSLRVGIPADAGARGVALSDVSTRLALPAVDAPVLAPKEGELVAARGEAKRLRARLTRLAGDSAALLELEPSLAPHEPGVPPRGAPIAAWLGLERWRRDRQRALLAEQRSIEADLRRVEAQVASLELAVRDAGVSGLPHPVGYLATFRLRGARAPAGLPLTVEYVVDGAQWVPTYRLRLAREGEHAQLEVRALVTQRTGEPWEGVSISLSTAELTREIELPELASIRIGRQQPPSARAGWRPPPERDDHIFAEVLAAEARKPSSSISPPPRMVDLLAKARRGLAAIPDKPPTARPATPPVPPPVHLAGAPMPPAAPPPIVPGPAMFAPGSPSPSAAPPSMAAEFQSRPKRSARPRAETTGSFAPVPEAAAAEPPSEAAFFNVAPDAPPESARPNDALLRYGELVMRRWNESQAGEARPPLESEHPGVAEARARGGAVASAGCPPGARPVALHAEAFDFVYEGESKVDLPSSDTWHLIPLFSRHAPVSSTLIVVPRVSTEAVRVATLGNPLDVPLLPGSAEVYWGDAFLVTSPLSATPAGGVIRIGLGVEPGLKVARNADSREETKGLIGATTHLGHEVRIEVASRLSEQVEVEVRERLPVRDRSEREELEVVVGAVEPAWEDYDQSERAAIRGGKRWRFTLGPGETRRLRYAYTVKFSAKFELSGGSRRE